MLNVKGNVQFLGGVEIKEIKSVSGLAENMKKDYVEDLLKSPGKNLEKHSGRNQEKQPEKKTIKRPGERK